MTHMEEPPRTAAMTQTHDYRYRLAVPGGHAACRMRVYARGGDVICLATEHHDRFTGAFLAEHATELATPPRTATSPGSSMTSTRAATVPLVSAKRSPSSPSDKTPTTYPARHRDARSIAPPSRHCSGKR
jgi:hypothetical protein